MLSDADVLVRIGSEALSLDGLVGMLGVPAVEVSETLSLLISRGWVTDGGGAFAGDAPETLYTLSPAGAEQWAAVLDRYANDLYGPLPLSAAEQFVLTLAGQLPPLVEPLTSLLTDLERGDDEYESRRQAAALARRVVSWAEAALDADLATQATAQGLRSVGRQTPEEHGYAARLIRDDYLPHANRDDLREVLASAASCLEAAWDLRALGPSQDGISHAHYPHPDTPREVADLAARTLTRLHTAVGLDVVSEAGSALADMLRRG